MAQYRPKDKRLKDKDVMTAWWLTFQPYGVDELKRAIGAYFREKHFWPDIDEITALLPRLQIVPSMPTNKADATKPGISRNAYFSQKWDTMMAKRGYPSLREWLDQGKPADLWWIARGQCQIEDPEWMALLTPEQQEQLRKAVC